MPARPFLIVRTGDQWLRCAHRDTALDLKSGIVQLAAAPLPKDVASDMPNAPAAGLAFDSRCRLYHGTLAESQDDRTTKPAGVEIVIWAAMAPEEQRGVAPPPSRSFIDQQSSAEAARFTVPASTPLRNPAGLAIDARDRLFIADPDARSLFVFDIARRRLIRSLRIRGAHGRAARPMDVAASKDRVFVALDDPPGVAVVRARRLPRRVALPGAIVLQSPTRIAAAGDGTIIVLDRGGTADARLISFKQDGNAAIITTAPFATDVECVAKGLVVALRRGEEFLQYADIGRVEISGRLKAVRYDGSGIVRTPDGRTGYWAGGFHHAIAARPRYARSGRVVTYRLDSGDFQTLWGRVFIDACIPSGTRLTMAAVAADEPPEGATIPAGLPRNIDHPSIYRPTLSPPLMPLEFDGTGMRTPLYRRKNGRELPWTPFASDDPFETYEAPVRAERGRYLWLTLRLEGNGRYTPRVRSVRIEHPGHDYLSRLPRTYSRNAESAAFLQRFLAPFEGVLGDLEIRSLARMTLVNPASAPAEILPWLAGFVGLLLDERLSVARRRALIAAGVLLLRARGTPRGLRDFIRIAIDAPVHIIEHFTLRGFGGPVLGYTGADMPTRSVLGSGFRIGGAIASLEEVPLEGDSLEAIDRRAHRFTVVVPGALSSDERGIVEHIIRVHRPAHTIGSLCTSGAGMRTGIGLHIGLTSVIGRGGGFEHAYIGDWTLGRATVVGQARAGTRPGGGLLGADTRVG
jgi:phage tail-like protein